MRKTLLSLVPALAGLGLLPLACAPGSSEFGSCVTAADCQVELQCVSRSDSFALSSDGGYVLDAGWCRRSCDVQQGCAAFSEVCGLSSAGSGSGYCSKDGGY